MSEDWYIAVRKTADMYADPVVEGRKEKVVEWLKDQESVVGYMVWDRHTDTYYTATTYLKRWDAAQLEDDKNAEREIRILRLVTKAMNVQDTATHHGDGMTGMHDVAVNTTKKIMKLFA